MRLVDLETAKRLKDLGYGDYCDCAYYSIDKGKNFAVIKAPYVPGDVPMELRYLAPRLDDAVYWLRERYKLLISIDYHNPVFRDEDCGYCFMVYNVGGATRINWDYTEDKIFPTYNFALEYALNKIIYKLQPDYGRSKTTP